MKKFKILKGHSVVDNQEKELAKERRHQEYLQIKHKLENFDDESDRYEDEIEGVSRHRSYSYRQPRFSDHDLCYKKVTLSSRGISCINTQEGVKFTQDYIFTYTGQAGNGTAVIRPKEGRSQYNVPFDCLIFIENM